MNSSRMESWKEVWERKGREACSLTLQELIYLDGFDKGAWKMTEEMWLQVAGIIVKELGLKEGDYLLEVGCGSGAMLLPLSKTGTKIAGIDYSESLVEVARKALPDAQIRLAEAKAIPFGEKVFSKILSHSVSQYFPDLDYATEVLREMARVLKTAGKILIMDIPDLAKKNESENQRYQALPKQEGSTHHPEGNSAYSHLYYPKSFFTDFAKSQNMSIKLFDQEIPGYANSPFRFNVLIARGDALE